MSRLKVFKSPSKVPPGAIDGSSKKGVIIANYKQLVDALGQPTYNKPSDDNRQQVQWVFQYGDNFFTIYDWKTFDRDYTENELEMFNVGGKTYAGYAIDAVQELIKGS